MQVGNLKIREVYVRWVGIVILSYLMALLNTFKLGEIKFEQYLVSFIFTTIYWNGAFTIFIFYRKKFPEIRQTPKRLVITFFTLLVFLLLADPLICTVLDLKPMAETLNAQRIINTTIVNLILGSIVGSVYENVYFFELWKTSIQLNEELKNQQIRTQFEVLQNQMSPHFLFNSLNTLTTLIAEDQKIAIDFTERLSEVYRYILQNKEKELVLLAEELEFVKAYIFLLQMRYPENLTVHFKVDEKYLEQSIAPLTMQMLVENAIKHNTISKAHPLHIEIYVDNGKSIIVKNNLQQKKVIDKSTKTGLKNIRKRYEYFGNHEVDVIVTANNFMVAVPLIQVIREKTLASA
jgi:two-component system, LytTR family, sensor kinase